jgi:hypothetical protein
MSERINETHFCSTLSKHHIQNCRRMTINCNWLTEVTLRKQPVLGGAWSVSARQETDVFLLECKINT